MTATDALLEAPESAMKCSSSKGYSVSANLKGMFKATRLTVHGRLAEATSFIQKMLSGDAPADAPPSPSGRAFVTIDRVPHPAAQDALNTQPRPWARTDSSWTVPTKLRGFLEQYGEGSQRWPLNETCVAVPEAGLIPTLGGNYLAGTFSNAAATRPYKLFVPSGYCGRAVPLIVMLHGCSQSADDFAFGTQMNAVAEETDCIVLYPQQTSSANSSKCWNWIEVEHQRRDCGEPSIILRMTREVMDRYAIDPKRVFVAGLAVGGVTAALLAFEYPDFFAAAGVHSAATCRAASDLQSTSAAMGNGAGRLGRRDSIPRSEGQSKIARMITFHGDNDKTVSPVNSLELLEQAMGSSSLQKSVQRGSVPRGRSYSRTRYLDEHGATAFEAWVIHGAGHAWAGGSRGGTFTDPTGPDASRKMVRFFLEDTRST